MVVWPDTAAVGGGKAQSFSDFRGATMNQRFRKTVLLSLTLVITCSATSSRADIIFSNLGPGDTFGGSAYLIQGANLGEVDTAVRFTPTGNSYFFDTFEPVVSYSGGTDQMQVTLRLDNSGLPGSVIETIVVSGLNEDFDNSAVFTVQSSLHPVLLAGVSYWLAISAVDDDTRIFWRENSTGQIGDTALSFDGGTMWESISNETPAFRVTATAVPEAHALALPVIGALLIAVRTWLSRFRSRQAG
jgi:hypothetical protein